MLEWTAVARRGVRPGEVAAAAGGVPPWGTCDADGGGGGSAAAAIAGGVIGGVALAAAMVPQARWRRRRASRPSALQRLHSAIQKPTAMPMTRPVAVEVQHRPAAAQLAKSPDGGQRPSSLMIVSAEIAAPAEPQQAAKAEERPAAAGLTHVRV